MATRTVVYAYGAASEPLLYDTYELGGAARKWLYVIHGGGWRGGSKIDAGIVDICNRANTEGWGAVSVEYQTFSANLATRFAYRHPVAINEIIAAFDHVLARLATYNFTGTGAVLGASCGGHFAGLLSCRASGTRPIAMVGMSGIYEPLTLTSPQLDAARDYLGTPIDRLPDHWDAISPRKLADASHPPTWLSNSIDEENRVDNNGIPLAQMVNYDARLAALGVTHHACTIPGDLHAENNLDVLVPAEGNVSVWTLIKTWLHDASRLG